MGIKKRDDSKIKKPRRPKRGRPTRAETPNPEPGTPDYEVLHDKKARQAKFLDRYRETGRNDKGCDAAGVVLGTMLSWRRNDKEFNELYLEARAQTVHLLEDAAHRRALTGIKRAQYHRGNFIGFERVYSDSLLMFLLKAADDKKYGDKVTNTQQGPDGGPIKQETTHKGLSDAAIKDFRRNALGLEE